MASITVGDAAPDFTLPDHQGNRVSLADYRGRQAVVVFFYPKDDTPVCTKEACSFRDSYEDFADAGAAVLGVSQGSEAAHASFARKHSLPFPLLVDADDGLRRAFGVPKTLGLLPGRVTYVIDKEGVVRHVFNSQLFADRHVSEALAIVRGLA
jgi:peroxiredoxin Q/BCP